MRRRNVAGESARLEARGAARGQHVVRAGDVVAERRGRRRRPRTGSRRCARGRRAPRPPRPPARGARARAARPGAAPAAERRARAPAAARRSPTLGRCGASRSTVGATASSSAASGERHQTGLSSPCSAWASRSSAISSGSAPAPAATTTSSLGPAMPVDADLADDLALRLLHVRVAGPDDHVNGRHRLGAVRQRGDRLGPAHPVDLGHLAEHAGGEDHRVRAPAGPGRGADGDLAHARGARGDGAHHDGRRVGARGRRARRRPRGATGTLDDLDVWPSGSSTVDGLVAHLRLRDGPHVRDRRAQRRRARRARARRPTPRARSRPRAARSGPSSAWSNRSVKLEHRVVAAVADLVDDLRDVALHVGRARACCGPAASRG